MYVSGAPAIPRELDLIGQPAPVAAPPRLGTFARVQHEAQQIVTTEPRVWRLAGNLLAGGTYRLQIQHPGPGADNRFRRFSFQGNDKCNLFALDVAWRSGFRVPVLNIGTATAPRYSYPLANTMTSYAERAVAGGRPRLVGVSGVPWGAPQTQVPAAVLNFAIRRLGSLLLLVGWRRTGTGHVGIIRHIHDVAYDGSRRITSITYDGWEATGRLGARDRVGRRWQTAICGTLTGACQPNNPPGPAMQAFCRIHIVSLLPEQVPANRGVQTTLISRCQL
jgi:hypothetical protein